MPPPWRRMNDTVFIPSAKSCEITAMKTSRPVAVFTWNASPMPSPSTKLWIESPAAPSMPMR